MGSAMRRMMARMRTVARAAWRGWVKEIKPELEEAAIFELGGPRTHPETALAALRAGRRGQTTENMVFGAAIACASLAPFDGIVLGPGFGRRMTKWGREGETVTGLEIARMALRDHADKTGAHGETEPYGYAPFYALAYLVACCHPDDEIRRLAYRLLWGELAIFHLTGGREVGCRATGGEEPNMVALLQLAAGLRPKQPAPDDDYRTLVRVALLLVDSGKVTLPRFEGEDGGVEAAIATLIAVEARCARGFLWSGDEHDWTATLADPAPCQRQGGSSPRFVEGGGEFAVPATERRAVGVTRLPPRAHPQPSAALIEDARRSLDAAIDASADPPSRNPSKPRPEIPEREPDLLDPLRHALRRSPLPHRGARKLAEYVLGEIEGVRGCPTPEEASNAVHQGP